MRLGEQTGSPSSIGTCLHKVVTCNNFEERWQFSSSASPTHIKEKLSLSLCVCVCGVATCHLISIVLLHNSFRWQIYNALRFHLYVYLCSSSCSASYQFRSFPQARPSDNTHNHFMWRYVCMYSCRYSCKLLTSFFELLFVSITRIAFAVDTLKFSILS